MSDTWIDTAVAIDNQSQLLCPRCGSFYLHHYDAVFYEPGKEDAESLVKISVKGMTVKTELVPTATSGNPSLRRDGFSMLFWCEQCGQDKPVELTISQHKGVSLMEWRLPPEGV